MNNYVFIGNYRISRSVYYGVLSVLRIINEIFAIYKTNIYHFSNNMFLMLIKFLTTICQCIHILIRSWKFSYIHSQKIAVCVRIQYRYVYNGGLSEINFNYSVIFNISPVTMFQNERIPSISQYFKMLSRRLCLQCFSQDDSLEKTAIKWFIIKSISKII